MGKTNSESKELGPVDSKHTQGQNIDSYDKRGESYEQDKKEIREDYDNYYYGEENSYDQEDSYYA